MFRGLVCVKMSTTPDPEQVPAGKPVRKPAGFMTCRSRYRFPTDPGRSQVAVLSKICRLTGQYLWICTQKMNLFACNGAITWSTDNNLTWRLLCDCYLLLMLQY